VDVSLEQCKEVISNNVRQALAEDIGSGDITAALIPAHEMAQATIVSRDSGIFCGLAWADETFRQVDPDTRVQWHLEDGDPLVENQCLVTLNGPARSILTAERTALNFLQLLSGTATQSAHYTKLIAHTSCSILDTRKTLPGLRQAQKYAVSCGGSKNHRMGLWDAYLIKENHIRAAGGIAEVILQARAQAPDRQIEIEVESLEELAQAISAEADIALLDNFSLSQLDQAVALNSQRLKLEASGGITEVSLADVADTGVDYISVGALTKNVQPLDLSLLFEK